MTTFNGKRSNFIIRWYSNLYNRWPGHRFKGCTEGACLKDSKHRLCVNCGMITCRTTMRVDPASLRRKRLGCCLTCQARTMWGDSPHDTAMRRRRTMFDWNRKLPDQYPGNTRTLVKDFLDSDESERSVGMQPAMITSFNQSLDTLGLGDAAYAEQRGNQVWLRRLRDGKALDA